MNPFLEDLLIKSNFIFENFNQILHLKSSNSDKASEEVFLNIAQQVDRTEQNRTDT